jgi:tRNA wybutosine-synthesizing protein 3
MIDIFQQRKKDVLSKQDKSSKGNWDKHIFELCEKINLSEDYYTTSSCSGRIVLMIDQEKKGRGLFKKVYHDLISFEELKKDLNEILCKYKKPIKLKMESCALHVACKNLEDAQKLYDKAKLAGWKKSGIISSGSRFIVELTNTDKLEFPIIRKGKVLVDEEFLKIIVDEANRKLKRGWLKIQKFFELI